jgi:Flp pilus assembly pilin Flp
MKRVWEQIRAFHADQRGATMLEYTILVGVLIVAMFPVIIRVLEVLKAHYQMIVYLIGLPFI